MSAAIPSSAMRAAERRPSSSSPSAVKKSHAPASFRSWAAATVPPPAGSDQSAVPCAIWPALGTRSTSTDSTHSTCPTTAHLTEPQARTFGLMMEVVAVPPFERFYAQHAGEVLGYLRRLLGQRAEDAWQETFLRALRAYDRLEHGRQLRAWVFTIATNVAMDELRSRRKWALADEVDGEPVEVGRPVYAELEHLTGDLPPK